MRPQNTSPAGKRAILHFGPVAAGLALLLAVSHALAAPASADQTYEIGPGGIGPWKIGAAAKTAPKAVKGIGLRREGKQICGVVTKRRSDRTREGLGVGSTFEQLEKAYGVAEVEAATGRLLFPGPAEVYDVTVQPMPTEGLAKPAPTAVVVAFAVSRCDEEPE